MLSSDEPKYHCWPTLIVVTKAFKLVIKILDTHIVITDKNIGHTYVYSIYYNFNLNVTVTIFLGGKLSTQ
jgi:hypothetical protein